MICENEHFSLNYVRFRACWKVILISESNSELLALEVLLDSEVNIRRLSLIWKI